MENKRIVWLDYAKVFGLYLVIMGHFIANGNNALRLCIYSFHMPLFFFISGYLHKAKTLRESIISGYKRILIPYLWLALFFIVIHTVVQLFSGNDMSDIFISLKGKITGTVTGKGKMFGASWFLLALFFVQTECDIILQLKKNIPVIIILIGLFILLLLLKHVTFNINFIHCDNNHSFHFPNLFNLKNSLMALPFFLAGFLFKEYKIIDTVIDYIKNRSIQYNTIQYNTIQYNTDSTCIPSTGRIFDWRIFQQTCIGI